MFTDFFIGISNLVPQLATMNPADIGNALVDLIKKVASDFVTGAINTLADVLKILAGSIKGLIQTLDASIYIPFISELYKWITGDDLSILDVFCLVLGAAVHIAYVIATGRLFCDDAATMPDAILPEQSRALGLAGSDSVALGAAPTSAPLPYGQPDSRALEITYVVARGLQILFTVGTDALFLQRLAQPTEPVLRAWMKVGRGMFGIISGTILFVNSTPDFMQKLMNEFSAKGIDKDLDEAPFGIKFNGYYISKAVTIYSLGLLGDVITFAGGVKGVWPVNVPAPGPVIELPQAPANARAAWPAPAAAPINGALPDTLDTMEFWFLSVRAMVLTGLMIYQCIQSSKGK